MSNFVSNSSPLYVDEIELMNAQLNAYSQITINGLSYDIVNGHFFIDGRYGYGDSQRICDHEIVNDKEICLGITN